MAVKKNKTVLGKLSRKITKNKNTSNQTRLLFFSRKGYSHTKMAALIVVLIAIGGVILYFAHAGAFYPATINGGTTLKANGNLESANNAYYTEFQPDGNLVTRRQSDQAVMWASKTAGLGANHMVFQTDGNLVIYNSSNFPLWNTLTSGQGGTHLTLGNDGNLVIYTANNTPLWSSNFGLFSCTNPFANTSYQLQRVDQGVDYGPNGRQPIKAPCRGTVVSTIGTLGTGWPGGVFIEFKFDPGIHNSVAGKCAYYAEYITNVPAVGTVVRAGDPIAYTSPGGSPPGSQEWGWAQSVQTPATPFPHGISDDKGGFATSGGQAFDRFMQSLGGLNHGLGTSPTYPPGAPSC